MAVNLRHLEGIDVAQSHKAPGSIVVLHFLDFYLALIFSSIK